MHVAPNIAISYAGLLLLAVVVLTGAWVLSRVFGHWRGRHRTPASGGAPRGELASGIAALFATVGICALPLLFLFVYVGLAQSHSRVQRQISIDVEAAETAVETAMAQAESRIDPSAPPEGAEVALFMSHDDRTQGATENPDPSVAESSESEVTSITLQTPDGKVVVVSLPAELVEQLSAANRAQFLEALSDSVPAGLRRAYALVPLPSPVSDPVVGGVQHVLAIERISTLLSAVADLWPDHPKGEEHTQALLAEMEEPKDLPAWIDNPGHGRFVVKTKFVAASEPVHEVLQPMLCSALMDDVTRSATRRYSVDDALSELLTVKLSETAVNQSVKETFWRDQPIETREGPKLMRQTYALVEFPDDLRTKAATRVQSVLQVNRTRALGVAIGAVWLTVVLLSFAARAGRGKSAFRRFAARTVLGLMMIPCGLTAVGMIASMSQGDIPPFQFEPTPYVVDAAQAE